tara:strand:- start:21375 stop:21989 length:615 start_codon:yes stop_codon:yes gene_type:complete
MQLTITQAAKMANVSRATIYNDIESGELSFELGAKNKKMINVAELERVYKSLIPLEEEGARGVKEGNLRNDAVKPSSGSQVAVLQERLQAQIKENDHIKELFEKEKEERSREREHSQHVEDMIKAQLDNQAESIKNFTRLLEDQRSDKDKGSEWKSAIQGLEGRIANQEDEHKKERDKILRQAQALKKALDAEKNKSFFQKLFG